MDLSVNSIGKKNLIKFKGVKGDFSKKNTPVLKFYPPAYDKENKIAKLEIAELKLDPATNDYITPKEQDFKSFTFKNDEPIELSQKAIREQLNGGLFAYRYAIEDKVANEAGKKEVIYIADDFKKIPSENGQMVNVIEAGSNFGVTPKTGPMRHSFVDSDVVLDAKEKIQKYNPDFVRNHFNKLGGSIKGLKVLLTDTSELDPYRYIISTPDIGVDTLSSHKYWPSNQYQCNDLEEFKDFIFELYKKGKGYVADGAFTSQGLQSPLVHHVLKWGKESPFYNMLKIDSYLQLGVLPDRSPDEDVDDLDYIAVKIVNNPAKSDYDVNKPIQIQFFDTRLVTDETRDKNELIKQYDKEPQDHYDITNHQNSVVPYHFEVQPGDRKRLSKFLDKDFVTLNELKENGELDDFLRFEHFAISTKAHASGANFWDGNRDIIKMNLSNPDETQEGNVEGFYDARNYLLGVATYWSELIQSDLILRTAEASESKKKDIAKNNDIADFEGIKNSVKDAGTHFPVLEQNKTVEDYVKSFPVQSIETDPDLSAIFSEPDFQKEFFDESSVNRISGIINQAIDKIIPEKYKGNEQYRTYVVKTCANKLIRNLLIGAMCPKALDNEGKTKADELKSVSLYSLGAQNAINPTKERRIIESKLYNAINPETLNGTVNKLKKELSSVDLDDFKLAETIVLRGKAGLNWRFDASRDIGDLDSVNDGTSTFDYIWQGDGTIPGVQGFWTDFVKNIKTYNPASYIISELTNMYGFASSSKHEDFSKKFCNQNLDNDGIANAVEIDFMNNTGSTTISNYSFYFNNLSKFAGKDPEYGYSVNGTAGNVWALKGSVDKMLSKYQPNAAILSHSFVDNHDKPRLLHAMPLNIRRFLVKDILKDDFDENNEDQRQEKIIHEQARENARKLTGRKDIGNISSAAVEVGMALKEAIHNKYQGTELESKLTDSLLMFVNGKKDKDSEPNFRRADAFAHTPYEISIRDIFKNAGINDEEEMQNFRYEFMKKYIEDEVKLWEVMNAIVGTPTLFNGTEFFQTGYETPSKNFYVANRNQTMHELKSDKRYAKHYDAVQNISSLYSKPDLSAIRDGFPVSGEIINKDDISIWPIYKYDDKGSKVIQLVTNNGIARDDITTSEPKNSVVVVDSLELDFKEPIIGEKLVMKKKYLKDDGKYDDKDNTLYILEKTGNPNDGKYILKAPNGGKIRLTGTVETFYFPKSELKGNEQKAKV